MSAFVKKLARNIFVYFIAKKLLVLTTEDAKDSQLGTISTFSYFLTTIRISNCFYKTDQVWWQTFIGTPTFHTGGFRQILTLFAL